METDYKTFANEALTATKNANASPNWDIHRLAASHHLGASGIAWQQGKDVCKVHDAIAQLHLDAAAKCLDGQSLTVMISAEDMSAITGEPIVKADAVKEVKAEDMGDNTDEAQRATDQQKLNQTQAGGEPQTQKGDIECPACKKSFALSDEITGSQEKNITCPNCKNIFTQTVIQPPSVSDAERAAQAASAAHKEAATAHEKASAIAKSNGDKVASVTHSNIAGDHRYMAKRYDSDAASHAANATEQDNLDASRDKQTAVNKYTNASIEAADASDSIRDTHAKAASLHNIAKEHALMCGMTAEADMHSAKSQEHVNACQACNAALPARMPVKGIDSMRAAIEAGDFPGHPFRGNQFAQGSGGGGEHNKASHEANEKSKAADSKSSHKSAKAAHERAAKLQEKEGHEDVAAYHEAMAKYHAKAADKA